MAQPSTYATSSTSSFLRFRSSCRKASFTARALQTAPRS